MEMESERRGNTMVPQYNSNGYKGCYLNIRVDIPGLNLFLPMSPCPRGLMQLVKSVVSRAFGSVVPDPVGCGASLTQEKSMSMNRRFGLMNAETSWNRKFKLRPLLLKTSDASIGLDLR